MYLKCINGTPGLRTGTGVYTDCIYETEEGDFGSPFYVKIKGHTEPGCVYMRDRFVEATNAEILIAINKGELDVS